MNSKTLTAIALVLALALAAATAKPNEPAGKEVAVKGFLRMAYRSASTLSSCFHPVG